eukprot:COSAG01_NODE_2_length_63927_cov_1357.611941_14_plen_80_part_00
MSLAYYFKVCLVLAAFVLVLGLALYFSRKVQRKRYTGDIKILDRMAVNQHVSLILVSAKEKQFFIGVGSKDVRCLHTFI